MLCFEIFFAQTTSIVTVYFEISSHNIFYYKRLLTQRTRVTNSTHFCRCGFTVDRILFISDSLMWLWLWGEFDSSLFSYWLEAWRQLWTMRVVSTEIISDGDRQRTYIRRNGLKLKSTTHMHGGCNFSARWMVFCNKINYEVKFKSRVTIG